MSGVLEAKIRLMRGRFLLDAAFAAPGVGVTALFGPSGAGKSLLLSALAGLARLQSGRIVLGERVLDDTAQALHTPAHRRGVGLVFQDARLLPHLSVRANLRFAQRRAPLRANGVLFDDATTFFEVGTLLDRPVHNLSGGEKSRVALARAVLTAPDFLLLDEPFAALDGARRRAFLTVLREMSRTFALPMMTVTHQIDDVTALADHVIGIREGRVVAAGPLQTAAADEPFQDLLDARDTGAPIRLGSQTAAAPAVWVRADNVLLARSAPSGLSARHVWPVHITQVKREGDNSVLVSLRAEDTTLFARVTPAAADELDLARGGAAWAIVKAHSL